MTLLQTISTRTVHDRLAVHAAIPTPHDSKGNLDCEGLATLLTFLNGQRIDGIVLNGATGEYPNLCAEQAIQLFSFCAEILKSDTPFMCGIGAQTFSETLKLGHCAKSVGASAVLLPGPFFFDYAQEDLLVFCQAAELELDIPIILYNLPRFAVGFDLSTVQALSSVSNIVAIKDSSGSLDMFRALASNNQPMLRLIGNDSVIVEGLNEEVCEGVISGVASVLPELIMYLVGSHRSTRADVYNKAALLLSELLQQLSTFPTPWGIKWIAEWRGFFPAHFSQPISIQRVRQAQVFREWFDGWWDAGRAFLQKAARSKA
ncbi:MAG TPA: dihydrodipicolinate synthase family protein [Bryobacteraceae bacterium]|jgi:4-hydroxy-tetrahydrodipicolinate synthase|nr:dihydrodipicolinate synthase family protein [Bryobacteraceae bacterium]